MSRRFIIRQLCLELFTEDLPVRRLQTRLPPRRQPNLDDFAAARHGCSNFLPLNEDSSLNIYRI